MPFWFFKRFRTPKANISLIGLDGAGKTTILNFLQYGRPESTSPTFGVDVEELDLFGLKLKVWDLGGQREFRKLWGEYVEKSNALIYVVDGADRDRIDEAAQEFHKAIRYLSKGVPLAIFINKIDLDNTISTSEVIEKFKLTELSGNPWQVFRTSGKYGFGLVNGFAWIYKKLTGKTVRFKINLDDVIVLEKGGNPIINLNADKDIPVEHISLVSEALKQFTKSVFKAPVYSINMRGRKLVLREGENLAVLAIVDDQEDDALVGDFLDKLLGNLEKVYDGMGSLERDKFLEMVEQALTA